MSTPERTTQSREFTGTSVVVPQNLNEQTLTGRGRVTQLATCSVILACCGRALDHKVNQDGVKQRLKLAVLLLGLEEVRLWSIRVVFVK